jgi:hypothetical protein
VYQRHGTLGGVIEAEVEIWAVPQFDAFVEIPLDGSACFVEAFDDGFLLVGLANDTNVNGGVLQIGVYDDFMHGEQAVFRTVVLLDDERELAAHEFTDFVETKGHGAKGEWNKAKGSDAQGL